MASDKIMHRAMKLLFPCKVGCTVHRSEENPCGGGLLWCGAGSIDSRMGQDTRRLAVCRNSAENLS